MRTWLLLLLLVSCGTSEAGDAGEPSTPAPDAAVADAVADAVAVGTGGAGQVCEPAQERACTCGTATGSQTCIGDGSGWRTCRCVDGGGGAGGTGSAYDAGLDADSAAARGGAGSVGGSGGSGGTGGLNSTGGSGSTGGGGTVQTACEPPKPSSGFIALDCSGDCAWGGYPCTGTCGWTADDDHAFCNVNVCQGSLQEAAVLDVDTKLACNLRCGADRSYVVPSGQCARFTGMEGAQFTIDTGEATDCTGYELECRAVLAPTSNVKVLAIAPSGSGWILAEGGGTIVYDANATPSCSLSCP